MARVKGTMFFSCMIGGRAFGWTESHYRVAGGDLQSELVNLQALAALRVRLLGGGVLMPYLRVSDDDVYRDSQVADGPLPVPITINIPALNLPGEIAAGQPLFIYNTALQDEATANNGQASDVLCDMPWSGVMVRMEAAAPYTQRRSLLIRGCPDYVIQSRTQRPLVGRWTQALTRYTNLLISGKWGFSGVAVAAPFNVLPLASINVAAAQPVFTVQGQPFPGNGRIRIRGTRLQTPGGLNFNLNGVFPVTNVTAPVNGLFTFQAAGLNMPFVGGNIINLGTVQLRGNTIVAYAKEVDRRWGERATGGPFDRPVGRRKKSVMVRS